MATRVKGARANKPNDSFGVMNNPNVYRNKYREEVDRDEDDDEIPYIKYLNILKKHFTRRAFEDRDVDMGGQGADNIGQVAGGDGWGFQDPWSLGGGMGRQYHMACTGSTGK